MSNRKRYIKPFVKGSLFLIILVSLCLFLRQTDMAQVSTYVSAIGYGYIYIILVTLIAMTMGTIAWRYTFEEDLISQVSFGRLFIIRLVGENIGLLNPANIVGGDAYKTYRLTKEGIPYHTSTSSMLLSRMIMIVTQVLTFIIAGLAYILIVKDSMELLWIIVGSIIFLVTLSLFLIGVMRYGLLSKKTHRLMVKLGWISMIYKLKKIYVQLKVFYRDQRKRFFKAVGFNMLNWLIGSLEFWLIFYYMSAHITVLDAVMVDQGVLFLKSFGAFIPGQIGVEEYANKIMLSIVGIKATGLWVAASIIRRSRQVFWIAVSGVLYIFIRQPKVSNLSINTTT